MPDLGPHAAFIWAAYAVTFVAVAVLVVFIVQDDRRQRQLLADLERQGIRRRSAKPDSQAQAASSRSPGRGSRSHDTPRHAHSGSAGGWPCRC